MPRQMSLLPDEIAGKSFPRRTRGYDPSQVSAFLQRAAAGYAPAIHHISWSRLHGTLTSLAANCA
jgi:DivIVA domain-containing protein